MKIKADVLTPESIILTTILLELIGYINFITEKMRRQIHKLDISSVNRLSLYFGTDFAALLSK